MFNGLIFHSTLTSPEAAIPHLYKLERKRPTPVRRRLNRTHGVLGRAIPGGWEGNESTGPVVLSNISTFHRWSAQSATLLLLSSDELISCCAAGTNGCLDLRCRAFPPRCPGPVKRRARDSMAPLRQNSAGRMSARIGRLPAGVGGGCEHCGTRQERSTLLMNGPGIRWLFATLLLQHPSQSQQAASRAQSVMSTFCEVSRGVGDTWVSCPTSLRGRPMWAR